MRRLFTFMLFVTGAFLWATETMVAEAASSDCVVDTRTTLGARLVHGTVRVSPVAEEANNGTTLLIDDTAPEWSPETPQWNSTTVEDGVHEAALYETEDPAKARLVVLNDDNYVYESGSLEGDVTWNNDAIHIVQYGVQIPEDSTLTVSEGTVVKLCQGADLIANGTLTAGKGAVFGNLSEAEIIGQEITVDEELNAESTNPVQNKVITAALNGLSTADETMDGAISALQSTLGTVQQDVGALQAGSAALETTLGTVQQDVGALQTGSAALETTLGTQQTALAAVKADMSSLQTANQTRDAAISALQADNAELKSQLTALLTLLNGGKEGQVLTKGKDGSLVWTDIKAQDTEVKTLALEAGWNLVAMPGRWLVEESDQALLDAIKIYTYDRETQVYTHVDGLKPLTSYWFYAKEPCTIHFAVIADEAK